MFVPPPIGTSRAISKRHPDNLLGNDDPKLAKFGWALGFASLTMPASSNFDSSSPGDNPEKAPDFTPLWVEALLAEALVTAMVR